MGCRSWGAKNETALGKTARVSLVGDSKIGETLTPWLGEGAPETRNGVTQTLKKLGYPALGKSAKGDKALATKGCCADKSSTDAPTNSDANSDAAGQSLMRRLTPWSSENDEIAFAVLCLVIGGLIGSVVPAAAPYAISVASVLAAVPVMQQAFRLAHSGAVFSM